MANFDLKRLDPSFRAKHRPLTFIDGRGTGSDRRHIITIDGRNYRPHTTLPREAARVAARVSAKTQAADFALVLGELLGAGLLVASITLLAVGLGPDLAAWLGLVG